MGGAALARPHRCRRRWSTGCVDHAPSARRGHRGRSTGAEVLNEVVVHPGLRGRSATTSGPARSPHALLADGDAWMSGSRWQGRDVLRVSVSNWSTDDADVERSLAAVRAAAAG